MQADLKIALAQLNYKVGDFQYNSAQIVKTIEEAKKQ